MRILRQFLLFSLILGLPLWAAAEQVYINDTLRVGVRPVPSSSAAPIAVVTTGMRLQVIDRVDGYLKIRGDDDIEGWIKDIYVVAEAPSVIKLQELKKKYALVQKKVKHLQTDLQVATEATRMLSEQLKAQKADTSRLQVELARKMGVQRLEEAQHSLIWWIGLFIIPILGFAGFYGGIAWYRTQTMKRLGGLRV